MVRPPFSETPLFFLWWTTLLSLLVGSSSAFSNHRRGVAAVNCNQNVAASYSTTRTTATATTATSTCLLMGLTLYGHPGTRSPLINWACYELQVDIAMAKDLSKNPHPFGQIPCLTDDDGVVVFESGAILQYILQQYYAPTSSLTKKQLAAITSWITWANASLDPICFLETPEGKVYDTGLRKPNRKIDKLNAILSQQDFLVQGAGFTIADVAVASYLLYVIQFFPNVDLKSQNWPAIVRFMVQCASRPAYAKAFGKETQAYLLDLLSS